MLLNELTLFTIYSAINEKFEIHLICRQRQRRGRFSDLLQRFDLTMAVAYGARCPRVLIALSYYGRALPGRYLVIQIGLVAAATAAVVAVACTHPRTCSINLFPLCQRVCVAQLLPTYHNNNA